MQLDRQQLTPWLAATGVALIAAVVLFANLGSSQTLESHEGFSAVPAQEMVRSGDWVVPRFGGLPRLTKPPLNYWLIAWSSRLFGGFSEWSVRFPSAFCSLLLVGFVGFWGSRWYGVPAGLAAALVQGTSVWTVTFGRQCLVDMPLCLVTTMVLFLIAESGRDTQHRERSLRWTAIYALFAVSWLAKFHFALAMVMMPTVAYFLVERRLRDLRLFGNPVGILIFAAAATVWSALVAARLPEVWDVWAHQSIGRAAGELTAFDRPFWFYIPQTLMLGMPWTPLVLAAAPQSWKLAWKERDPRERFLWVWFLMQFAIVTVTVNKHPNYMLTAMPVFSLVAGRSLAHLVERLRQGGMAVSVRTAWLLTAAGMGGGTVIFMLLTRKWYHLYAESAVVSLVFATGACLAVWLLARGKPRAGATAAAIAGLGCYWIVTGWILPGHDRLASAARFAEQLREEFGPLQTLCIYDMGQDPIAYYMQQPLLRIESKYDLISRLQQEQQLLVVIRQKHRLVMDEYGECRLLRTMPVLDGKSPPKLRPLLLVQLTAREGTGQEYRPWESFEERAASAEDALRR